MKTNIPAFYLIATLFFTCAAFIVKGQDNVNTAGTSGSKVLSVNNAGDDEKYAHVFIYYPLVKSGSGFSVYMNRKNIGKLNNGSRIECRILLEGPVAITLIEGNLYREPFTQSKNSRIISVKKAKSYYFRVNGSGELEYVFNAQKGEKSFNEAKDFMNPATAFTETPASTIPALDTAKN